MIGDTWYSSCEAAVLNGFVIFVGLAFFESDLLKERPLQTIYRTPRNRDENFCRLVKVYSKYY